ncbi:TetR/AcrR family transcriptional regulator [Pseudomonas moraviensis subsp. stanleyae]|uniref:TetR/AcrR family transcriptional regulator n=1 Tax=Pseudomonas moraviensis TaxID=321662 RepID=UPI002E3112D5|nr:TetR/AcrR family transcriptional regulator [Pseudomonas moraviensis]MED7666661.1 TetR/AcrR family transcriptional regulator [Pseudomonas moraviensis subsp. stanleyae]
MKRYKCKKAEATRLGILKAASALFHKHGVKEVGLSRVMAELDLTCGGFYKYFESKENLAVEVCDRSFHSALQTWQGMLSEAQKASQAPAQFFITQYLDLAESGHCPIVALGQSAFNSSHDQSFLRSYRNGTKTLLDTMVSVVQDQGFGMTREQALIQFSAMLGVSFLFRAVGSELWVKEIQQALSTQAG